MKSLLLLVITLLTQSGWAGEKKCQPLKSHTIEGDYVFKALEVEKSSNGKYRLRFSSAKAQSSISIVTDHAHASLKVGQTYLISAESNAFCGEEYVAQQVRVVFQTPEGPNPIWIRSSGAQAKIKEKLLKQHAPMSDFVVF